MEGHQQIAELLLQTLSPDGAAVAAATDALERVSLIPNFPFSLLSLSTGSEDRGLRIAAAAYLKNFTRRSIQSSKSSKEFKDMLLRALLIVDSAILKILIEVFCDIVATEFVKENSWPELVSDLRGIILKSDLIDKSGNCEWKTINALTILQSVIRPFQYFLDPKVAKEPVPPQLELIAQEILVPLLDVFHHCVKKILGNNADREEETEKLLLIICKCIFFAVRSYMPSSLSPCLSSFCRDLFKILASLSFDGDVNMDNASLLRMKTGKRSLLILCSLVTRHRKVSDKLMPNIITSVLEIVKHSAIVSKLDFLSERVISLAFDVVSRVLETGPGWRLVSPHFSTLLNSAIFPALVLNDKDTSEWEEDADEYMRKNLPCELEEISGFKEDTFTTRKSALNLLGVMSLSKGPPVAGSGSNTSTSSKRKKGDKKGKDRSSIGELLVLPFLSKFPLPSDFNACDMKILNEYYGVLMAYGSLQDFLCEQKAEYSATLVRTRVLPLYKLSTPSPYLIASANWVLGELVSCLPEEMSADVYMSLLKALNMPDMEETSCYPVWVSASGAITELIQNEYLPPEWLSLLQVVIGRIADEREDTAILFELLGTLVEASNEHVMPHIPYIVSSLVGTISKCIPQDLEPWPQMVERGFSALVTMAQCWEDSMPDEDEESETEAWVSGQANIVRDLSSLLQQAWLTSTEQMGEEAAPLLPPPSCIDDSSALLRFIMQSITESSELLKFKVTDLLLVWANLIEIWHSWEETEDLSIFNCIKESVSLHQKFTLPNFIVGKMPSPPAPPVHRVSIAEAVGAFLSEAFSQYPSAVWRAFSCAHMLLHVPRYTQEAEAVKQSLVIAFTQAAFSRFKDIRSSPCSLWKPLLLALSSCYLVYPDIVEKILDRDETEGFTIWATALCSISSSTFESGLSLDSEIKLIVLTLAKVVERLLKRENPRFGLLQSCFTSLLEASVRFKEAQEEDSDEESGNDQEDGDEDTDDDDEDEDEDSEEDEREETEEEFLDRYAKAAIALENGTAIEEGDDEDQELELEMGELEDVDPQNLVFSLLKGYHQVLAVQPLPPQVISSFVDSFPECNLYFEQHS